jgi:ankyrin repeat protein
MIRRISLLRSFLRRRTECERFFPVLGSWFSYLVRYRFRWVFCQLEVLRHCLPASIRRTLDQLPQSLDDTYSRTISQIPQANQDHAHRMLQCLVVAVRPLYVEELADLLAFDFDAAQGGIPKYRPSLRLDDQTQAVLSTCSSLVTIIKERWSHCRVVQFSHFSVKEFLVSNRLATSLGDLSRYHIRLRSSHAVLTQACLGSLLHSDDHITAESIGRLPLAEYAAECWDVHAQFEDVVSCVKDGIETLFDPDKPHFAAWVNIFDIDIESEGFQSDDSETPNPLYYSVLYGFYDLINRLSIKHPHYVNAVGGRYRFPLLAALAEGDVKVAQLLLEHGADVNVREATGMTMLLMAFSCCNVSHLHNALKFLLEHGANVNARDDSLTGSLHLAEEHGRQEVVPMLLKHKADVNAQDINGKTPLHVRLERKWYKGEEVSNHVRLLLEHGADVNRRDKHNQTPLHLAIGQDRVKLAELLLENGADANAEINGMTPLHLLLGRGIKVEGDAVDLVSFLLKHGAEVNSRDKNNQTPLHQAIRWNQFKTAGILLENGADANAETNGMTPLHLLVERGIKVEGDAVDLVSFLLKHGAEVNSRDKNNQTPLHQAIRWNQFKTAGILLENGADANAETNGMTPLHLLVERGIKVEGDAVDLVSFLLKHGAEVNSRDKHNQTPLHLGIGQDRVKLAELLENGADANAEINGMTPLHPLLEHAIEVEGNAVDLISFLLKHGAEANSRDKNHETPLHLAVRRDQFKTAGILLENGADANAETNGMTPLHILLERVIKVEGDAIDLVSFLLKNGAEVNSRDKNNETPIHLAVRRERFKLVRILLENGADANAENNKGETPLRILSESRHHGEGDFVNHARLFLVHVLSRRDDGKEGKRTPFMRGLLGKRMFEFTQMVMELGVDATIENNMIEDSVQQVSRCQYDSWERCLGVAQQSLENEVDFKGLNVEDENQTTSTYWQSHLGSFQIRVATLLLYHGAKVNAGKIRARPHYPKR